MIILHNLCIVTQNLKMKVLEGLEEDILGETSLLPRDTGMVDDVKEFCRDSFPKK